MRLVVKKVSGLTAKQMLKTTVFQVGFKRTFQNIGHLSQSKQLSNSVRIHFSVLKEITYDKAHLFSIETLNFLSSLVFI